MQLLQPRPRLFGLLLGLIELLHLRCHLVELRVHLLDDRSSHAFPVGMGRFEHFFLWNLDFWFWLVLANLGVPVPNPRMGGLAALDSALKAVVAHLFSEIRLHL
ncbi:hypothetical protein BvCmsA138A_04597 [Escherichia coli]|nr:hypothetical protein BvCmsA138A_04597 [Escherichia coli]